MVALAGACGDDGNKGTIDAPKQAGDAGPDASVPPRVIAGGGIGDGPIAGVANVYVIDDTTRLPVTGASVTVGTVTGTTDATGLFVATGVTGKQTVLVTAAGYRAEMWVGADGVNMTIDVQSSAPVIGSAPLTGTIDMTSFTVLPNHVRLVGATYSQSDTVPDAANNLDQNGSNSCLAGSATASCTVTVTSRTGNVALVAAILDDDTKGTVNPGDDTFSLLGWAVLPGLTVANGVAQTGLVYDVVTADQTVTEKLDFGTPPAGLPIVEGIVGVELGSDGVLDLPFPATTATNSLLVPELSEFPGASATYRFTTIAQGSDTSPTPTSVTVIHAQTGTSISAPPWLAPATGLSVTRTTASWTSVDGALVQGLTILSGNTQLLSVTSFDGTTSIDIPPAAGIPASGALTANVTALAATGIDLTNFGLDADREKITADVSAPAQVAD